jgi:GMP synthase (glutamine-hydrolysing)
MARPLVVIFTGSTVPDVKARFGDFDSHFRAAIAGAWEGQWSSVDARQEDAPLPDPDAVAGVIITGSAHSVTERAPWMLRLEAWIRDAVAREMPLLGVCFGHQLIGSALGGEVRRNPRGRRIGTMKVRRTDEDPLLEGLPQEFDVNLTHQDHVSTAPAGIRKLITADHDDVHAFAVGNKVRAVQFHPEFHDGIIRGYISARRNILKDEGLDPDAIDANVMDAPHARRILHNFVRHFARRDPF